MTRHHPISPITERMQYRAIGLIQGQYKTGIQQELTSGLIYTHDGTQIPSVTLGKLLNLMRNHIQLDRLYLWIVYPRCREIHQLHLQIVGVWEPKTSLNAVSINTPTQDITMLPEDENYFSVRGEMIYTEPRKNLFIIQIRQIPRGNKSFIAPFRLQVQGKVPFILLNHFLALDLRHYRQKLVLERYVVVGPLTKFY